MQQLKTGQFFGDTNQKLRSKGITITDTIYTHPKVDWHYHENAYFTFILIGNLIEGNKKEVYQCNSGSLLFHNWQEPHYNIKPEGTTRGFHVELNNDWVSQLSLDFHQLQGSFQIHDPSMKLFLYKIFKESKLENTADALPIESLMLEMLSHFINNEKTKLRKKPNWVAQIRDLLYDTFSDNLSLSQISEKMEVHPVHLSRDFSKYYHCTLGEFTRKIKIEKALMMLPNNKLSISDIAYDCNFSDQSHFIRCFKNQTGITPLKYRKLLK